MLPAARKGSVKVETRQSPKTFSITHNLSDDMPTRNEHTHIWPLVVSMLSFITPGAAACVLWAQPQHLGTQLFVGLIP